MLSTFYNAGTMSVTLSHRLIVAADANHHGTIYAGSLLRIALEAAYATAWRHIGTQANVVLRRVLNMECLRPVPVGVVVELQGVVLRCTAAYLVCGLVGMPLDDEGPWAEALFGFAQVNSDGKLTHVPDRLPAVHVPAGDVWTRLEARMTKLLRVR